MLYGCNDGFSCPKKLFYGCKVVVRIFFFYTCDTINLIFKLDVWNAFPWCFFFLGLEDSPLPLIPVIRRRWNPPCGLTTKEDTPCPHSTTPSLTPSWGPPYPKEASLTQRVMVCNHSSDQVHVHVYVSYHSNYWHVQHQKKIYLKTEKKLRQY